MNGKVAVNGRVGLNQDGALVEDLIFVGVGGQVVPGLVAPLVLPGGGRQTFDVTRTLTWRQGALRGAGATVVFVRWAVEMKYQKIYYTDMKEFAQDRKGKNWPQVNIVLFGDIARLDIHTLCKPPSQGVVIFEIKEMHSLNQKI